MPYAFTDPLEVRIHEGLLRLGQGPATFFRNACELVSMDPPLEAAALLVASLCREIESALRDVLGTLSRPAKDGVPDGAAGEAGSHAEDVRAILAALEIETHSDVGQAWLRLTKRESGFVRWVHRSNLDPPRKLDPGFRELWFLFLAILDTVLRRLSEKYLDYFAVVEELAAKDEPTDEDLARLRGAVPQSHAVMHHFFSRLQGWKWLGPLQTRGFFDQPPAPVTGDGGMLMVPWPQSEFLKRMASESAAQEQVLEIILMLPVTDNGKIHSDLIEAANYLPVPMAAQLLERARAWATGPWAEILADDLAKFAVRLVEGQYLEEGIPILNTLLELDSESEPIPPKAELPFSRFRPKPRSRIDSWRYGDILEKCLPRVVAAAPMKALDFACSLLDRYLVLSEADSNKDFTDGSGLWRPDLGGKGPEHGLDLDNTLVTALRCAAEQIIGQQPSRLGDVVGRLLSRRWTVFRRLALQMLAEFPAEAPEELQRALADKGMLEDLMLDREYHLLLARGFPYLPAPLRDQIIRCITEGPSGADPEHDESARRRWQLMKLHPISDHLPQQAAAHYGGLVAEFGEPGGPPEHFRSGSFCGPTSPASTADLAAMAPADLAEYLRTWRSSGEWDAPTPEGLSRTLSELVAECPETYAAQGEFFKGLDATYVHGFFAGWSTAAKNGRAFPWPPVLDLAVWAMAQPREIAGRRADDFDADPHWGWSRKRLGDLLSNGLRTGPAEIPADLREVVWGLLSQLIEDPDPDPADEQRPNGMDPFTLSINTVRGEAMHAIMRYIDWSRRHDTAIAGLPTEVVSILEAHLDPAHDGSAAVRAVIGWSFPHLFGVDSCWATARVDHIFPVDEQSRGLWQAAFFTYVQWQPPYKDVFPLLAKHYDRALSEFGQDPHYPFEMDTYHEHLAEHLLGVYWRGNLHLNSGGLLERFFRNVPPKLRGYAMAYVGRVLSAPATFADASTLERLTSLWLARWDDPAAAPQEHIAFGWWFSSGRLDALWSFAQLRMVLNRYGAVDASPRVAERLVQLADKRPTEVIATLDLMLEKSTDRWLVLTIKEQIRQIVSTVLSNPQDQVAAKAARDLVNVLAARGHPEFRDLIKNGREVEP